jgi:hypothetical protein
MVSDAEPVRHYGVEKGAGLQIQNGKPGFCVGESDVLV